MCHKIRNIQLMSPLGWANGQGKCRCYLFYHFYEHFQIELVSTNSWAMAHPSGGPAIRQSRFIIILHPQKEDFQYGCLLRSGTQYALDPKLQSIFSVSASRFGLHLLISNLNISFLLHHRRQMPKFHLSGVVGSVFLVIVIKCQNSIYLG